jgi:hypothetical protein
MPTSSSGSWHADAAPGKVATRVVCETKGDMMPQAWVTFTGSSVMRLIREPKLVMKASARASRSATPPPSR